MAYQTGTATDLADLRAQLETFLTTVGWTINRVDASGPTGGPGMAVYHANAGYHTMYITSAVGDYGPTDTPSPGPYWHQRGATGYSVAALDLQPGSSLETVSVGLNGPFQAYHFMATTQYCYIIIELTSGVFNHSCFGRVNPAFPTLVGGEFTSCLYWNHSYGLLNYRSEPDLNRHKYNFNAESPTAGLASHCHVRADIEGTFPAWMTTGVGEGADFEYFSSGWRNLTRNISNYYNMTHSPSGFNGVAPLFPVILGGKTSLSRNFFIGECPDVRFINITNLSPGQEIVYGPDTWKVFPFKRKSVNPVPSNEFSSGVYGIAYKKII